MGWLERLEGWRGRSRVGVGKMESGRYIGLVTRVAGKKPFLVPHIQITTHIDLLNRHP